MEIRKDYFCGMSVISKTIRKIIINCLNIYLKDNSKGDDYYEHLFIGKIEKCTLST
jgi:hypothetical protein